MKKLLRLGDMARGGRERGEVYDLLGIRAVAQPRAPTCRLTPPSRLPCRSVTGRDPLWGPNARVTAVNLALPPLGSAHHKAASDPR